MKISKQEYDERAARVDDGTATDDDRRLVALYATEVEPAGFAVSIRSEGEVVKAKKAAPRRSNR